LEGVLVGVFYFFSADLIRFLFSQYNWLNSCKGELLDSDFLVFFGVGVCLFLKGLSFGVEMFTISDLL